MKLKFTKHPALYQLYFSVVEHWSLAAFVKDFNFGNYVLFGLIIHIAKEFIVKIHCAFLKGHIRNPVEETEMEFLAPFHGANTFPYYCLPLQPN